jgi:hypothetical protein
VEVEVALVGAAAAVALGAVELGGGLGGGGRGVRRQGAGKRVRRRGGCRGPRPAAERHQAQAAAAARRGGSLRGSARGRRTLMFCQLPPPLKVMRVYTTGRSERSLMEASPSRREDIWLAMNTP